jgi:hypothetical protein
MFVVGVAIVGPFVLEAAPVAVHAFAALAKVPTDALITEGAIFFISFRRTFLSSI